MSGMFLAAEIGTDAERYRLLTHGYVVKSLQNIDCVVSQRLNVLLTYADMKRPSPRVIASFHLGKLSMYNCALLSAQSEFQTLSTA